MDIAHFPQINPPQRLLMGPGPINADPRVLRAMSSQLIGQYDPAMTHYMNEVMALYRGVFRTENRWTMLVDGTSRAGIEAILVSAIRPGDKVLVPVFGRFGHLLCEIARRCRAEVHTIEVPWGEVFTPDQVEDAIKRIRPRLLLTVQGDTSTTMLQPLAELGAICRRYDVLFYTDATASLGGNALETDAWGLDAVSAGMQKCLGGPSGTSPVTLSTRMEEAIRRRKCVEAGIRTDAHRDGDEEMIYSNYFDLGMDGLLGAGTAESPYRSYHRAVWRPRMRAADPAGRAGERHCPPQAARRCAPEGHSGDGAGDLRRPEAQDE
jgi:(S)-ureidoglycine-glyoxylate aminotransferase